MSRSSRECGEIRKGKNRNTIDRKKERQSLDKRGFRLGGFNRKTQREGRMQAPRPHSANERRRHAVMGRETEGADVRGQQRAVLRHQPARREKTNELASLWAGRWRGHGCVVLQMPLTPSWGDASGQARVSDAYEDPHHATAQCQKEPSCIPFRRTAMTDVGRWT